AGLWDNSGRAAGIGAISQTCCQARDMLVLHLVTYLFPPAQGGLEMRMLRLVRSLSQNGVKVIVHICAPPEEYDYGGATEVEGIEIRLTAGNRAIWEEPLAGSGWPKSLVAAERRRLDFLSLRSAIAREMTRFPDSKHVITSNFITTIGFLAATAAEDLGLPHIACVVGTDYSRGFRNPAERAVMGMVAAQATCVVTTNGEQERAIRRSFGARNVITIHSAVDAQALPYRWKRAKAGSVALFSDGGYSHKKGTQVLLWSFGKLREESLPVTLTICGNSHAGQQPYWRDLRSDYSARLGTHVKFFDHVALPLVWDLMSASDVYCSATLGEGCSAARVAALCMGMPIVTTRCGEMPDVAEGAGHVRLAAPGDATAYLAELRRASMDLLEGRLSVDSPRVEAWRAHFAPSRELGDWQALLRQVTA
ncbi:MAG TPA: glycosyltransferase family 4 protein, partial [Bryobacterales bacterium]|nr:glycosyltransferase family 4 protein [Bryobacterales bacterium]